MYSDLSLEEAYRIIGTEFPDVVTAEQAGKMLNMGRTTVYKLIDSGRLKCIPDGRKKRIPKLFVIEMILMKSQD